MLIFSFLTAEEVLSVATVSKLWCALADNETIWEEFCTVAWPKLFSLFSLDGFHPFVNHENVRKALSVGKLRKVIRARNDLELLTRDEQKAFIQAIEKSELQSIVKTTFPRWLLPDNFITTSFSNAWKASFIVSRVDKKRGFLRKAELCKNRWTVHFKHPEYMMPANAAGGALHWAQFNTDFTHQSSVMNEDMRLPWRFIGDIDEGRAAPNVSGRYRQVAVHSFPPLFVTRTAGGGWQMENVHVVLVANQL